MSPISSLCPHVKLLPQVKPPAMFRGTFPPDPVMCFNRGAFCIWFRSDGAMHELQLDMRTTKPEIRQNAIAFDKS